MNKQDAHFLTSLALGANMNETQPCSLVLHGINNKMMISFLEFVLGLIFPLIGTSIRKL